VDGCYGVGPKNTEIGSRYLDLTKESPTQFHLSNSLSLLVSLSACCLFFWFRSCLLVNSDFSSSPYSILVISLKNGQDIASTRTVHCFLTAFATFRSPCRSPDTYFRILPQPYVGHSLTWIQQCRRIKRVSPRSFLVTCPNNSNTPVKRLQRPGSGTRTRPGHYPET
jgi:hypothetical protein